MGKKDKDGLCYIHRMMYMYLKSKKRYAVEYTNSSISSDCKRNLLSTVCQVANIYRKVNILSIWLISCISHAPLNHFNTWLIVSYLWKLESERYVGKPFQSSKTLILTCNIFSNYGVLYFDVSSVGDFTAWFRRIDWTVDSQKLERNRVSEQTSYIIE